MPLAAVWIGLVLAVAVSVADTRSAHADDHPAVPAGLPGATAGLPAGSRFSDHFETRAGIDDRLVVPAMCETEGERALIELAGAAEIEEAFVFVPSECLWIEIGYDESDSSVATDLQDINRLSRDFGPIALYHIHPGRPADARRYFPAYGDLLNALILSPVAGPAGSAEIRHRAVTARGIIDYAFVRTEATDALIARMQETGLADHLGPNLLMLYGGPARAGLYHDAVRGCDARILGDPDRLAECFPIAFGEFRLDHRRPGEGARRTVGAGGATGVASAMHTAD